MTQATQDAPPRDAIAPSFSDLPHTPDDREFQSHMGQLGDLLEEAQRLADPAAREATASIIQSLMDFHGAAIARIVDRLHDAGAPGKAILRDCARDDLVSSLLVLYGLNPLDLGERINIALEKVRPALAPYGGNVDLHDITPDGAVHLKYHGKSHTCGSTIKNLRATIEQAVYDRAPDLAALHLTGLDAPPANAGFVPVEQLVAAIHKHAS